MLRFLIINGPNLNLLGTRQPEIYGHTTLNDLKRLCHQKGENIKVAVDFRQSNSETAIIDWLHEAGSADFDGVIINAAGYSHTSIAIADGVAALNVPVIEVHISNIYAREQFRATSHISRMATGVVCGLGVDGYLIAMEGLKLMVAKPRNS